MSDHKINTNAKNPSLLRRIPADGTTPHEVIRLIVKNNWNIVRAWREYLGLTQADITQRLNLQQSTYVTMEKIDANLEKATRERIATAMGLLPEHLEF